MDERDRKPVMRFSYAIIIMGVGTAAFLSLAHWIVALIHQEM